MTFLLAWAHVGDTQAKTIRNNLGGLVDNYTDEAIRLLDTGEEVRFFGRCVSACTIFLALPEKQLCAGPGAQFGFHYAIWPDGSYSREVTEYMVGLYPRWVKTWIAKRGGLTAQVRYMPYDYAKRFMRRCS